MHHISLPFDIFLNLFILYSIEMTRNKKKRYIYAMKSFNVQINLIVVIYSLFENKNKKN